MPQNIPYFLVDVFTDSIFGGNQLAVVPHATDLSSETMQNIAREFNFSETTFVLPPTRPENTRRVRIFTPRAELPFAGHPNIGTAFVLVDRGLVRAPEEGESTVLRFEEDAGVVPVAVARNDDDTLHVQLTAPQPTTLGETVGAAELCQALGLEAGAILETHHPPRIASSGLGFLCVEIADLESLERARLRSDLSSGVAEQTPGILIYTRDSEDPEVDLRVRMFAPLMGVPEDPATGSAACALAGLMAELDGRVEVEHSFVLSQGSEIGRPSRLYASATKNESGEVTSRVAGRSVLVASGELVLA